MRERQCVMHGRQCVTTTRRHSPTRCIRPDSPQYGWICPPDCPVAASGIPSDVIGKKLYVASSWRNEEYDSLLVSLWIAGHEVYDWRDPAHAFSWSDVDENWRDWTPRQYRRALQSPLATKGYTNDLNGMNWCDTGVLLLPCGKSAHLEAGFLAATGRTVHVLLPSSGLWAGGHSDIELMYRLLGPIHLNLSELLEAL